MQTHAHRALSRGYRNLRGSLSWHITLAMCGLLLFMQLTAAEEHFEIQPQLDGAVATMPSALMATDQISGPSATA